MAEELLGPSGDGSVILDIGDDVGALVLHTTPEMLGREIDLMPDDDDVAHTHSAVRERQLVNGVSFAAVYPALKAGTYLIEGSVQRVTIAGGRVTELHYDVE